LQPWTWCEMQWVWFIENEYVFCLTVKSRLEPEYYGQT